MHLEYLYFPGCAGKHVLNLKRRSRALYENERTVAHSLSSLRLHPASFSYSLAHSSRTKLKRLTAH